MPPASRLPPTVSAAPSASRLPSLDGWRAFSILLVLGSHCKVTAGFPAILTRPFIWLFDGSLGVRFFFVISGFLITWLMLVEKGRSGRISLRHFYVRRALRILPVYGAFLCALLGLQMFTRYHLGTAAWLGNVTFTTNFVGGNWTNGHLWSLAEEEQFYLLWPSLLALLWVDGRGRVLAKILAAPVLIAPVFRLVAYVKNAPPLDRIALGLFSCDSLAFGCIFAILFYRYRAAIEDLLKARRQAAAVAGATAILVPYCLTKMFVLGFFTVPFGESVQGCGIALLLMQSIADPGFLPYRALNWRWVREIGILSYSIYIWQQIFCTNPAGDLGVRAAWWFSFPGWMAAALATAVLSYYGLERPLLRLRARYRSG